MSLRTRLIIVFLLLSVLPLSAVTFLAHRSWVGTFEAAAQREATASAADMGRRMERIMADVGRRMDRMFVEDGDGRGGPGMRERVAPMLGDTASLVERVELRRTVPAGRPAGPPPPPAPPEGPGGAGSLTLTGLVLEVEGAGAGAGGDRHPMRHHRSLHRRSSSSMCRRQLPKPGA